MHKYMRRVRAVESVVLGERDTGCIGNAHGALGQYKLAQCLDLRLVQRCDTDLETYADIRLVIAWADGDDDAAKKWQGIPPLPPQELGETARAHLLRCASAQRSIEESLSREHDAVTAAHARIARESKVQS